MASTLRPTVPLHFEKRLRVIQTKRGGQKHVVADPRMKIEREMGAVEREVVLERELQRAMRARDRLQPRPEQTVMHDEQIYLLLDRHLHRPPRGIHRGADLRHRAGVLNLQAVERVRVILDLGEAQGSSAKRTISASAGMPLFAASPRIEVRKN